MDQLSEEQKSIINAPHSTNLRIIASAGSGKTTTLISRILYLIKNHNLHLHEIILTTFTKDATEVMKNKIKNNIHLFYNFMCGTIDAIARKVLHVNKILDENVQLMSVSEYIHRVIKFSKTEEGIKYFKKFKYLFVDEFQDIDYTQYIFFKRLNELGLIITVVGDPNQNIYSFRQSDINYLINFDKYFTNTQTFFLSTNYRSTNEIIELANESIQLNKIKLANSTMNGTNKTGTKSMVIKSNFNNYDMMILTSILKKVKNYPLHEIAILSRNNFLLLKIENILYKYGIANVLLKDDDIRVKKKENHITLSTIHKSKGLEFELVYVVGCDDTFFPRMKDFLRVEEERRLFYVATTRAKSRLYYFYLSEYICRFLTEINPNLLNWENAKEEDKKISEVESVDYKTGITEIIKNLRGEDFIRLRNKGILPNTRIDKSSMNNSIYINSQSGLNSQHVYNLEGFKWTKFVKKENLYTDFGNYFDCIITRFILEETKQTISDKAAFKILHNIPLDKDQANLLKKYRYNFIYNFNKLDDLEDTSLIKNEEAKKCIKMIDESDKKNIENFIEYLKKYIKNYSAQDIHQKDLFLSRFNYDQTKIKEINDSYIKFTNPEIKTMDILTDIFNVSKCNSLLDNRLRMLYVTINETDLDEYQLLIHLLKDNFIPYIKKFKKIECKKYVSYDIYHGECDLVCDDLLLDYKCSENNFLQIEWIVQLLCYTQMLRDENYTINKIGIFNVLNGKLMIADISKWNKGKELFEYLLNLQEKILAKDHQLESEIIELEENIFNIKFECMDINPFVD